MRKPNVLYPSQTDSVTDPVGFPDGAAQNDQTEDDGTGFPFEKEWVNDHLGFHQALLRSAGLTPDGTAEKVGQSQLVEAIKTIGGSYFNVERALQEWSAERIGIGPGASIVKFPFLIPSVESVYLGFDRKDLIAVGYTDTPELRFKRSQDGTVWDDDGGLGIAPEPDGTAISAPNCAAPGLPGAFVFYAQQAGVHTLYSVAGHGSSAFEKVPDAHNFPAVTYAKAVSRHIAARANGTFGYSGMATFAAWSTTAAVATSFATSSLGTPGGEFADDGSSSVLYCGSCVVGGVTRFRIFRSTNGSTWALVLEGDAGLTHMNVVWHAAASLYVALLSNGKLYTSPDGATWTLRHTTAITASNGADSRHGTLVSAGIALVKMHNAVGGGGSAPGVFYSYDLGKTWRVTAFGMAYGNTYNDATRAAKQRPLLSLAEANGRVYASDGWYVYRSGCLTRPPVLYTS